MVHDFPIAVSHFWSGAAACTILFESSACARALGFDHVTVGRRIAALALARYRAIDKEVYATLAADEAQLMRS
jgi:hypothetical protein